MGLVGSWYSTWFSTLCQRGFPLAGSTPSPFCCLPFAGAAPFQAPVCGSTSAVGPCGWVGGVFAASLGFLPCAVLFLRACSLRSFPSCRLPWGFTVTGCLSFCFPGDVGWASALPFFFCASPAPLACRGWLGYAPCVRVLQLRWCLLGLKVRSPCCPSLTFCRCGFLPWAFVRTWVSRPRPCLGSYLILVVLPFPCPGFRLATLAVGWSRHLLFSWALPWVLPFSFPVLAAGLRWLRFILGCPPSVASLWRLLPWFFVRYLLACPRGAAVPLDSWVLWCS